MEAFRKILRTPSAFAIIVVAIVSLLGVIIKSKSDENIARMPISATATAEAKLTAIAQVFAITPASNIPTLITPSVTQGSVVLPSETPSSYTDPIQFMRDYFSLINERKYQEAWSKLSDKFKKNATYNEYTAYWNTVEKVEITSIEIRAQNNSEAIIYAEIIYHHKEGEPTTGHTLYKLVKDSAKYSWLIDPN